MNRPKRRHKIGPRGVLPDVPHALVVREAVAGKDDGEQVEHHAEGKAEDLPKTRAEDLCNLLLLKHILQGSEDEKHHRNRKIGLIESHGENKESRAEKKPEAKAPCNIRRKAGKEHRHHEHGHEVHVEHRARKRRERRHENPDKNRKGETLHLKEGYHKAGGKGGEQNCSHPVQSRRTPLREHLMKRKLKPAPEVGTSADIGLGHEIIPVDHLVGDHEQVAQDSRTEGGKKAGLQNLRHPVPDGADRVLQGCK